MQLNTYPNAPGYKEDTTSKDAADSMATDSNRLQREVLRVLRVFGPKTADEAACIVALPVLTIRPRFSELRSLGQIEPTGRRRKNSSGRSAMEWRLA
jgi:predicted ArsR family transcriptional regulator